MYECLAYSKKGISGGLCKMNILFGHCGGRTNNVKRGKLVETLKYHASTDYHKGNMVASHNFLMVMDGKYDVIVSIVVEMPLQKKIFAKLKKTTYFTIMADETTDTSIKEQLAICIRYFDTTSYEIQEKFFKFIGIADVSGINIARSILQVLDRPNLDISYCCGQAYDAGSNMSGLFKGIQARIEKLLVKHALASIRNAIGVTSSVSNFFQTEVRNKLPHLKKGKHAFKNMRETRWVEQYDAVLTFLEALPCIPVVSETIYESSESIESNVFSFLHATQLSEFLVSVVVLAEVFGLTLALAQKLQGEYMDVLETMKLVETILTRLREQHYKSTDTFKKIFKESEKLAVRMGTQINKPRTTNLQKNRSNFNTQIVEEYYRTAVYLPFMYFIINELSSRLPKSELLGVQQTQKLLSPEFSDGFEDKVLKGAEPYKGNLPSFSALKGVLRVWKQIWKSEPSQKFPKSPAEGYEQASALPNIRILFQLLCVLPVTTNTVEFFFSTLCHLETYLRTTMTEYQLNGLALLHIHQDIGFAMKPEEVLDIFARKHKRKLSLNFF
ncbi:hypothetical protein PR048_015247 [Dryococelus australis]|uniref:DUF4371 domain-containing protein n=1 Tax=Dryococelus australis TaxID=614101 RepID=A0ABQ9HGN2_9NEOP|nr:hypothetical protein PR048_015247 [Dryococelus australis]